MLVIRVWCYCLAVRLSLSQLAGAHRCEELLDISGEDLFSLPQLQPLKALLDAEKLPVLLFNACRARAATYGATAAYGATAFSSRLRGYSSPVGLPPVIGDVDLGDIVISHAYPASAPPRRGQGFEGEFSDGGAQEVSDGVATPGETYGNAEYGLATAEVPGQGGEVPGEAAEDPWKAEAEEGRPGEAMGENFEGGGAMEEGGEIEEGGEELEGEEEEEFHYSDVDVGVGGMLLGSVAFVMLLFYFVNWQDDDIRRYSWSIISTTVSIFTSVLTFHGINNFLMKYLEEALELERSGFFIVLISYTFFLVWFSMMQLIIAFETNSLSSYAPANLNEETWVIANAMRWDYGMTIDTKYVRTPTAIKSIAIINDTEIFVQRRQSNKEKMERRTVAVRTLFSHMAGFACIHAGVELQHIPFFSQNPFMAFMAAVCNRFFLFSLFKLTEANEYPRLTYEQATNEEAESDPHIVCADMCKEEVKEAENDVASLATSFLIVQAMRYSLTGVLPNGEGLEEPPIAVSYQQILSLYGLGFCCMLVVMLLLHTGLGKTYRQAATFQNTMGMSLSWCLFWSTRWVASGSKVLEQLKADPETMTGRIMLALILSGLALSIIFILDHIEDGAGEDSEIGTVIQNAINALSILVGFSWEHCFDFSLEACASKTSNPTTAKLLFTGLVCIVITPAWRRYILVKVIQLNQMNEEESAASSKKTPKPEESSPPSMSRQISAISSGMTGQRQLSRPL